MGLKTQIIKTKSKEMLMLMQALSNLRVWILQT